jgi:hypothetical protein
MVGAGHPASLGFLEAGADWPDEETSAIIAKASMTSHTCRSHPLHDRK